MATLSANTSVAVALAAGDVLTISGGYGTAQIAPPVPQGLPRDLVPLTLAATTMGPYPAAVNINLVATSALTYTKASEGAVTGAGIRLAAQGAIPMILQSSCTVGANGAVTGLTAFNFPSYPVPCYLYFGPNAIGAGVAAGWYYSTITAATTATVFNNPLGSDLPTIPASPTAFSGTTGGAYTQSTGFVQAISWTLPADTLGVSGSVELNALWNCNSTAGTKNRYAMFGSAQVLQSGALSGASNTVCQDRIMVRNRGRRNAQVALSPFSGSSFGPNGNNPNGIFAVDTSVAQTLGFAMALSVATDYIVLDGWDIRVYPGS